MSLAIEGRIESGHLPMGQNGRLEQWGIFAFNSTDASGELPVQMQVIEEAQFTPLGAPASDEIAYVNETSSGGQIPVPSTGTITIGRTGASPTSGLKFFYRIRGY